VESVQTRKFYLAEYEPMTLSDFTVQVQAAFGAPHVRELSIPMVTGLTRMGDSVRAINWKDSRVSTFQWENFLGEELEDLAPLEAVARPLPFSVDAGTRQTDLWMEETDGKGKSS
jgi:hypothetical protein